MSERESHKESNSNIVTGPNDGPGRVLTFARLPTTSPPDDSPIDPSSLTIYNDLADLLANGKIRMQYKAGRYEPGKNVSLRLYSYTPEMSHVSGSISYYSHSAVGAGVVTSLGIHIGCMHMLRWRAISKLATLIDEFHRDQEKLSRIKKALIGHYLSSIQPRDLPRAYRTFTVPLFVSDLLADLTHKGFYGVPQGIVASHALLLVFANQRHIHAHDAEEFGDRAIELEVSLNLKAKLIEETAKELDEKELERSLSPRA